MENEITEAVTEAITEAVTAASSAETAAAANEPSNLFVVLMGLGIVFIGLICIILILELMAFIFGKIKVAEPEKTAVPAPVAAPVANTAIENRGEIVAAVCAAVAEELGTDISALRVVSFKKL